MYYTSVELTTAKQKDDYREFVERVGMNYEETSLQLGVYEGTELIGGVSLDNNCIKLLRVSCDYTGMGISDVLVSDVIKHAYDRGILHLFVYTKPENEGIFNAQGFYTIVKTKDVIFLENTKYGIRSYVKKLDKYAVKGNDICSIVMNLNPITLGHEYLIKTASEENDWVHIFLVKEDISAFPYDVRLDLLQKVASRYGNVTVHEGSDYIISGATFPTYFIKSKEDVPIIYAVLDITIFGEYIAKALGINVRYIGTEPYSKTTNMYNQVMKDILPCYNVRVKEVYRKELESEYISASKVRELIKMGNVEEAYNYLPEETIKFLKSTKAKEIIQKIKISDSRH